MKRFKLMTLAAASASILIASGEAKAQTAGQLQACRNYVVSRQEFRGTPVSAVQVYGRGYNNSNGNRATVDWRITRNNDAEGYCVVNRNGRINQFQITQNSVSQSSGRLETNWGTTVRAYRARITNGDATLVNRPVQNDKRDVARVRNNEEVTVYREYYERNSRITWLLVEGSQRQRGWINSERVTGGDSNNGNNGDLETNWGRTVNAFRARITSGTATLVNRPVRDDKEDIAQVQGGELVTVYREYYENSSRTTWYLVEGQRRQRGWINAERVGDGDNNDGGSNSRDVEYNWGRSLSRYSAVSNSDATLVNRPVKNDKRDVAEVSRNEQVTVLREYYESSSRINWYLVRGRNGQEGWINSERISERSPR